MDDLAESTVAPREVERCCVFLANFQGQNCSFLSKFEVSLLHLPLLSKRQQRNAFRREGKELRDAKKNIYCPVMHHHSLPNKKSSRLFPPPPSPLQKKPPFLGPVNTFPERYKVVERRIRRRKRERERKKKQIIWKGKFANLVALESFFP